MEALVASDYRIRELSAEEDAPLLYAALFGALEELPRWEVVLGGLRSEYEVLYEDRLMRVRFTLKGIYCESKRRDEDYMEELALSYSIVSRLPRRYRIELKRESGAGDGMMVAEDIALALKKWLPEGTAPVILW